MTARAAQADGRGGEPGAASARVESVDLVRGCVMVLMVLDHVRDYVGDPRIDPTDLAATTPGLYFTRWVTHFCAPTFVFLAGASAFLSGTRRTRGELSRRLAVRGLWLIVLEQTVASVGMSFTYPHLVLALILWAIGWSMIALAGLVHLPRAAIGAVGVALIALHNLADGVEVRGEVGSLVWSVLHVPGFRILPGGVPMLVGYPLVPWVGLMALGYALGPTFLRPPAERRRRLVALGLGAVAGFAALRASNLYGDPRPWASQATPIGTAMSFLNCQKYPPSLLYLLMTLGPMFLALAAFDRGAGRWARPLRVFGRVPLFFYLVQWPIAHGLAVLLNAAEGHPVGWLFRFPPEAPPGATHGLPAVFLAWAVALGLLYPLCARYGARRRRPATE